MAVGFLVAYSLMVERWLVGDSSLVDGFTCSD